MLDCLASSPVGVSRLPHARPFSVALCGGAPLIGDDRAILQYRRMLRQRLAEYEKDLLGGYRLAREIAECGLAQAGVRLEGAVAQLQREIGQARSQMLVLENIAEKSATAEGESH